MNNPNIKELLLVLISGISLLGLFVIAVIDPHSRTAFLDVAKLSVGACIGYLIPNSK